LSCCKMKMPLDNTNDGHFKLRATVNFQNIFWTEVVKIVRCVRVFWCHYWHLKPPRHMCLCGWCLRPIFRSFCHHNSARLPLS
jgi:hypothetical protein